MRRIGCLGSTFWVQKGPTAPLGGDCVRVGYGRVLGARHRRKSSPGKAGVRPASQSQQDPEASRGYSSKRRRRPHRPVHRRIGGSSWRGKAGLKLRKMESHTHPYFCANPLRALSGGASIELTFAVGVPLRP